MGGGRSEGISWVSSQSATGGGGLKGVTNGEERDEGGGEYGEYSVYCWGGKGSITLEKKNESGGGDLGMNCEKGLPLSKKQNERVIQKTTASESKGEKIHQVFQQKGEGERNHVSRVTRGDTKGERASGR